MLAEDTVQKLIEFRRDREWERFHTPKNLAIAIVVEASELLEQFQWTGEGDVEAATDGVRHEMADVAILLTYLSRDLGVDLNEAVQAKLAINEARYPVVSNRGVVRKPK